jgi:hypothetical protein
MEERSVQLNENFERSLVMTKNIMIVVVVAALMSFVRLNAVNAAEPTMPMQGDIQK